MPYQWQKTLMASSKTDLPMFVGHQREGPHLYEENKPNEQYEKTDYRL